MLNRRSGRNQPDTFICHASEDKDFMARPLHQALKEAGVSAWLDESEIRLGQSIRQKIDEGLANCRSGTVILSRPFFSKNWTQYEMDGLVGRQMQGEILLFPIQHGITIEEIRNHSPSLAGLSLWNSSDRSFEEIAAEIVGQLGVSARTSVMSPDDETRQRPGVPGVTIGGHSFGVFYIAHAGTPELLSNANTETNTPLFLFRPEELTGWIPLVNNNEELEYIVEGETLRIRLSWGNSLSGTELLSSQMITGREPVALTIRQASGSQIYFPSVVNQSPSSPFSMTSDRSGWMTFRIT